LLHESLIKTVDFYVFSFSEHTIETIVINMYSNCQTTKVHFVWRPVCLQIIRWSTTK